MNASFVCEVRTLAFVKSAGKNSVIFDEGIPRSALFDGLSPATIMHLKSLATRRVVMPGEMLFKQGQLLRNIILVESGSVKIAQAGPDGKKAILLIKGAGDVVGVCGVIAGEMQGSSAQAMERSDVSEWNYAQILSLATSYPQIMNNLTRIAEQWLEILERRYTEIVSESSVRRIGLALIRLMSTIGRTRQHAIEVCIQQDEIAQLTGVHLLTVCRTVSRWASLGLIAPAVGAIIIPDPERFAASINEER